MYLSGAGHVDRLWQMVQTLLDAIYYHVVGPLFGISAKGLEFFILKPLQLLGLPPFIQVAVIALLTGILSVFIKKALRVDEKEQAFIREFEKKKAEQENFKLLEDWKSRKLLYETSDGELDEMYNTYLSRRFAWFGMVYLLPVFLCLYWLDSNFSAEMLIDLHGSPYLLPLPPNFLGIPGLSTPLVFFVFYLFSIFFFGKLMPRLSRVFSRRSLTS